MSLRAMAWAQDQKAGSAAAKLVLLLLADIHHEKSDRCDPSIRSLAERSEMSVRSVRRMLTHLEEAGLVGRILHPGGRTEYLLRGLHQARMTLDNPGQIDRGEQGETPDSLAGDPGQIDPRTDCHPYHWCPGTPDTGVRGIRTGFEQEDDDARARVREGAHAHTREAASGGGEEQGPVADPIAQWESDGRTAMTMQRVWNEVLVPHGVLPWKAMPVSSFGLAQARAQELRRSGTEPDEAYWRRCFEHLAEQAFLMGHRPSAKGRSFRLRPKHVLEEGWFGEIRAHAYCDPETCSVVRNASERRARG